MVYISTNIKREPYIGKKVGKAIYKTSLFISCYMKSKQKPDYYEILFWIKLIESEISTSVHSVFTAAVIVASFIVGLLSVSFSLTVLPKTMVGFFVVGVISVIIVVVWEFISKKNTIEKLEQLEEKIVKGEKRDLKEIEKMYDEIVGKQKAKINL